MSFQAMAWAIKQKLPTHDKFVLLMLANYASNEHGDCYPSLARLSEDTALSKDSVIRAIKSLEALGLLAIKRRMVDGVNLPNIYKLALNLVAGGVVADSDHYSPTAAGVVADSDSNLSIEPINNKEKARTKKDAISFDFQTGAFVGLKCDQKDSWSAAYPATNIDLEVLRAAAWLKANPANRKSNYARFLTNWLTRAQDGARPTGASHANNQQRPRTVHDERSEWLAGMRKLTDRHLGDDDAGLHH